MSAQSLSNRTINERIRVIRQFEAEVLVPPLESTPDDLIVWLASLKSETTRHTYYLVLRAFFQWLTFSDVRSDNPVLRILPPKRPKYEPRPVTEAQVQAVLKLDLRPPTRTRILLGAFVGMRVHEIAKIQGQEFDPIEGRLRITGKGRKTNTVPLHPIIIEDLKQYPSRGFFFPSRSNKLPHAGTHAIRTTITDAFDRVGVSMTPHQLRHYFATALLSSGVDSRIVQKLMRHENLSTTAQYMGVSITQQQEALGKLDLEIFNKFQQDQS